MGSFPIAIISVAMSAKEIVSRFVEGSAGITNGAYSGYMCREESPGELQFTPVASMGGAPLRTVRVLEGEVWTHASFCTYLMRFFGVEDGTITIKREDFPDKESARQAFAERKGELIAAEVS